MRGLLELISSRETAHRHFTKSTIAFCKGGGGRKRQADGHTQNTRAGGLRTLLSLMLSVKSLSMAILSISFEMSSALAPSSEASCCGFCETRGSE